MKLVAYLLSCFVFLLTVSFTIAVSPTNFINDEANILTTDQKTELETLVKNYQAESTNEIGVLIVPDLKDQTVEELAVKTFEEWGIGKKGQDNGVLLLIAVNDRELRMEVGYGLEGSLTDIKSSQIIRDIITPEFKNSNYFSGIDKGLKGIISVLKGDSSALPANQKPSINLNDNAIAIIFIVGYLLFSIMVRTKSWWLGGIAGAILGIFLGGISVSIILALLGLLVDFILSKLGLNSVVRKALDGIHRSGGGFRGGSSGGGFGGGFGGGSSGGGGASGKW